MAKDVQRYQEEDEEQSLKQCLLCFCTLAHVFLPVLVYALMISAIVYGNEKGATLPAEPYCFFSVYPLTPTNHVM